MENLSPGAPSGTDWHIVIAALEQQLAELDRRRARIAAAHLDAAIQQLRMDQVSH